MVQHGNRESSWLERAGPTWIVAGVIYLAWGLVTWNYAALPWWLVLPVGAFLLAWHGSLRHEAIHGQLAPWRWLNDAVALPPLELWLPFPLYRAAHRAHHDFEILTEPWRDPESFYVDQATWRRLPAGSSWPGVSMKPGHTAFTRMGASVSASERHSASTAPLIALVTTRPGMPLRLEMPEKNTMLPLPRIRGAA